MAIYATAAPSTPRELAPDGNQRAVCYAIYDLGTHQMPDAKTGGFKAVRKVRICFELSDELMSDGRPFGVSQEYTLSVHEKSNLGQMLEKWRGKPFTEEERKKFNITVLLGQCCLVNVVHEKSKTSDQIYANVGGVSRLVKGMAPATAINQLREFSIESDQIPEDTPDWIAAKIRKSAEWMSRAPGSDRPVNTAATTNGRQAGDDDDEDMSDVPF